MDREKAIAWKTVALWKKAAIVFVSVIFALRIGYIAIRGEVDKAYVTSGHYDLSGAETVPCKGISQTFIPKNGKLDSLELYFTGIADDKAGSITVCIYSGEFVLYQTGVSLANVNNAEWKKVFVNAQLKSGAEYKITMDAGEECTKIPEIPVVNSGYAPEIQESFLKKGQLDGNLAVNYGYLQFPGRADRVVMASLCFFLYAAIFFGILYFEMVQKYFYKAVKVILSCFGEKMSLYVVQLLGCFLILNCSGIGFQELTKAIFYCLSLAVVYRFREKREYIREIADKAWKKAVIFFVYCYAAFALVGQRIFAYPLDLKVTSEGLFIYTVTVLWFIPVINSVLYGLDIAAKHVFQGKKNMGRWQFASLLAAVLLLPAAYNLFANNPGISSPDTYASMVVNAKHLHGMFDWHPAFYCMVLRAIESVWDSTYAVIAVQYFFWAYVMVEFFLYLRKKGVADVILICAALFFGMNAGNFIHLNTIWKDIPYTLSLLWAFILTAKLAIDFEEYKSKRYIYVELIVALTGVFFYRKNGIVTFCVIVAALCIVFRKNRRVIASLVTSVVLVGVIKGPVYTYFQVVDPGTGGMYHGLGQDILGAYYSGGEVSEDTLQMITKMTGGNNSEYEYKPTWSAQQYGVDVRPSKFIINYIDTFLKNPILMARAVINREDALWDIYQGQDAILGCVNNTATMDGTDWNNYYPKRIYRSLYTWMSAATGYTANAQWLSVIEWRCGLLCLLGLASAAWLFIRFGRRRYLVMVVPAAGHVLSLLLSTGWSDFRYFWPMNLMNACMIWFVIVITGQKGRKNNCV